MADTTKPVVPPAVSGMKPRPKPEGWWSLPGHQFDGSRAGVLQAVQDDAGVPDCWKEALTARINAIPAEFNQVKIDAHACVQTSDDGKRQTSEDGTRYTEIYHFHISAFKKL